MGFFHKIKAGLSKTRSALVNNVNSIINSFTKIDEDFFEELEEILVMSDIGVATANDICEQLRAYVKKQGVTDPQLIKAQMAEIIFTMLDGDASLHLDTAPSVILVIGVNGVGKTTTIGIMALQLKNDGK